MCGWSSNQSQEAVILPLPFARVTQQLRAPGARQHGAAPTKGERHKVPGALAGLLRRHPAVCNDRDEHAYRQTGELAGEPGGCWPTADGMQRQWLGKEGSCPGSSTSIACSRSRTACVCRQHGYRLLGDIKRPDVHRPLRALNVPATQRQRLWAVDGECDSRRPK